MQKKREYELLNNPIKVLEKRTKDSKLEMEVLENLQELMDLSQWQVHVDFGAVATSPVTGASVTAAAGGRQT